MDGDSLTTLLARGLSVEKIAQRFGKHPSTVSYWMAKYGLEAPNREKHTAKGGIAREQLEQFTEAGMTIAEIAAAVDLSKTTVRHWLGRYGLKTRNKVGPRLGEEAKLAKLAGQAEMISECLRHGDDLCDGGPRRLRLPAMSQRANRTARSTPQGDAGRRSGRVLPALRLRPLPGRARIPSRRPGGQTARNQRQRADAVR